MNDRRYNLQYERHDRIRLSGAPRLLMVALLGVILSAGILAAEEPQAPETPADPIHITADRLVSDTQRRNAQFSGNVKVVQGDTTITADRLTLVYAEGASSEDGTTADSIERIEADGNVRIVMDGRVAESERAIYRTDERTLVLTGQNAKVTSGQDVIESSKITFYRDSGNVKMEGDPKGQVKAIIRSNQRGLN